MPAMGSHGGLPLQEYQMETRRSTPTCYPTMEGFALRRLPIRFKVSPGIENGSLIGSRHGIPQGEALHCHARPVKPSNSRGWRSIESPERPAITYQLQPISYYLFTNSLSLIIRQVYLVAGHLPTQYADDIILIRSGFFKFEHLNKRWGRYDKENPGAFFLDCSIHFCL